tara:strand:+ start:108 stop:335 length:228 start_codon:yes stop_codon:yes gene_type:complete
MINLGKNMKTLTKKQRHQVKSRWYYIFWGAATISVFAGQMYVGSGYRKMAESFDRIVDTVVVEVERGFGNGTKYY